MQNGYFFCGDLLGFKNITQNLSSQELDIKIEKWVSIVENCAKKHCINKFQLISDTIFAAVDDDKDNLSYLVQFVRELLNTCITESLCLRGAIVRGSFTFNNSLVYGDAVIRAHQLEQEQNWIGALIESDHSLDENDYINMDLITYAVPMRSFAIKAYASINWSIPCSDDLSKFSTSGGLTKAGEILNWKWAVKIENTILFNLYKKYIETNKLSRLNFLGHHQTHWIDCLLNPQIKHPE